MIPQHTRSVFNRLPRIISSAGTKSSRTLSSTLSLSSTATTTTPSSTPNSHHIVSSFPLPPTIIPRDSPHILPIHKTGNANLQTLSNINQTTKTDNISKPKKLPTTSFLGTLPPSFNKQKKQTLSPLTGFDSLYIPEQAKEEELFNKELLQVLTNLNETMSTNTTTTTKNNLIDGKKIAATVQQEIREEIENLKKQLGRVPGLATVLVGERKDSMTYVKMKRETAKSLGIHSIDVTFPDSVPQEELEAKIRELNSDPQVDGILVQLPLPKHINEEKVLAEVSIDKDVDGFHPVNIGRLSMKGRNPKFIPCTPKGVIELLDRMNVEIEGKNAVVVGRSNIVGIPVAMLLLHRNATVQICHSKTQDIAKKVKDADIIVAACGIPNFIKKDWVKQGAVVIDVGINAVDDKTRKSGYRLVGDVDFDQVKDEASLITPVPGGVGPMTIAMLMKNTLESFKAATPSKE